MPKPLQARWFLQALADAEVARIAPGSQIIPVIRHDDAQIAWDRDCGVGRVPWRCGYILPPDNPSALAFVPMLKAAIAPLQEQFDLGVTPER
jgi:hypothetical protein